jgi:hypothetical protein
VSLGVCSPFHVVRGFLPFPALDRVWKEWHRSDGRYQGDGENHQRQSEATGKPLGAVLGAFEY